MQPALILAFAVLAAATASCSHAPKPAPGQPAGPRCTDATGAVARPSPEKDEVVHHFKAITPAIKDCASDAGMERGTVLQVRFTIAGKNGAIDKVAVLAPAQLDRKASLRSCIRRAADGICFAPFTRDAFYVSFPFKAP